MKKYAWKNNVTVTTSNALGKLAVKTEKTNWLQTIEPVVVPISIKSKFHTEISGDLKMNALMSTIKDHVRGRITILFTEGAHLVSAAQEFNGNKEHARAYLFSLADKLKSRYEGYFSGCQIAYWSSYISDDPSYIQSKTIVEKLYKEDPLFKRILLNDLSDPNDDAIQDLIEMCICQLVLASKGYRFQFYPGSPYTAIEYVSNLLSPEKRTVWVNVFLSIEKKQLLVGEKCPCV